MGFATKTFTGAFVAALILVFAAVSQAGQVWTKCHITCRCLQDNAVGNFSFVMPVDVSPDIGFDADLACKSYGDRICLDACNGLKYSFTYQVTSP